VLFTKVAKETLGLISKGKHTFPTVQRSRGDAQPIDIATATLADLLWLFVAREKAQFEELSAQMQSEMAKGKKLFDVWMYASNDEIQAAALSLGSRICLEQSIAVLAKMQRTYTNGAQDQRTHALLGDLLALYALRRIEVDLAWFLTRQVLSLEQGRAVTVRVRALCRHIAPYALSLVEGFGIPKHMCIAPIAADWVKFNEGDNRGEVKNDLSFLQ
jgi:acyl-CoA oxidase